MRIQDLTEQTTLSDTDVLVINNGSTKKITVANLKSELGLPNTYLYGFIYCRNHFLSSFFSSGAASFSAPSSFFSAGAPSAGTASSTGSNSLIINSGILASCSFALIAPLSFNNSNP